MYQQNDKGLNYVVSKSNAGFYKYKVSLTLDLSGKDDKLLDVKEVQWLRQSVDRIPMLSTVLTCPGHSHLHSTSSFFKTFSEYQSYSGIEVWQI
ncbi:hypothetical protein J6590_019519 [Homalodisca vitripennis]|nr:hypothetical protein J6590_019519 [Homalodisca vitripennis]